MAGQPIRVVIADDEPLIRAGIRMILNSDPEIQVVGEAADGRAAVEAARA
ncbi:response regulator transcription factor, partial [Streptomyces sp. WAC08241]